MHELLANLQSVLLKSLLYDNIQYSCADCTGNSVTTKSTKELHPIIEGRRNVSGSNDSTNRMSVADRLSKDADVSNNSVKLKSLEMCTNPLVPSWHFIGNTNSTFL